MLTHFKVSNYKCLVDVELPLTPIHVIIGQNDSGKTSLLEAMLALSRSAEMPLSEAFEGKWTGRELVNEQQSEPRIRFDAHYETPPPTRSFDYRLELIFPSPDRACYRTDEFLTTDKREIRLPLYSNFAGAGPFKVSPDVRTAVAHRSDHMIELRHLVQPLAEMMWPAAYYRLEPRAMALPAIADLNRKFRMEVDGFGLSSLLEDIKDFDDELFLALRRDFCTLFPQFKRVYLEKDTAYSRTYDGAGVPSQGANGVGKAIRLETRDGNTILVQHASDGVILFLGILALMYTPKPPRLILIEEPEKGIYPPRLEEVIRLLRRLSEVELNKNPAPQIIMTTHSPYLLSFFQPEEATFLSRREKMGSVRARPFRDVPSIHERLGGGEFYLGELWYNLSEEELFGDA